MLTIQFVGVLSHKCYSNFVINTIFGQLNKPPKRSGGDDFKGSGPFAGGFVAFGRIFNLTGLVWSKKPLALAVALTASVVFYAAQYRSGGASFGAKQTGIFGGPLAAQAKTGIMEAAVQGAEPVVTDSYLSNDNYSSAFAKDQDVVAASVSDSGKIAGLAASRENLLVYKIQKGDTLSGIASYFGVSLDTIVNANPSVRGKFIQPGDTLNILPTSGIVYATKDGDTLESIASYFNVPESQISQFNKGINFGVLGAGISLVIPGARNFNLASIRSGSLPNYSANFIMPAEGYNWGILHHNNAVDIAAACGTPIRAAAEGLVVPDDNFGDGRGGWSGGYGNFVLIEHPFGDSVRTRYAHLKTISVEIGDYVQRGQIIGLMGETGDATGCHVHFEVYGAQNPFAKS